MFEPRVILNAEGVISANVSAEDLGADNRHLRRLRTPHTPGTPGRCCRQYQNLNGTKIIVETCSLLYITFLRLMTKLIGMLE